MRTLRAHGKTAFSPFALFWQGLKALPSGLIALFRSAWILIVGGAILVLAAAPAYYAGYLSPDQSNGLALHIIAAAVVALVIVLAAYVLSAFWLTFSSRSLFAVRGQASGFETAKLGLRRGLVLAPALAVVLILVSIGLALAVLPGIYLLAGFSFLPFVLAERRMSLLKLWKESWSASRGSRLRITGLYGLAAGLALGAHFIPSAYGWIVIGFIWLGFWMALTELYINREQKPARPDLIYNWVLTALLVVITILSLFAAYLSIKQAWRSAHEVVGYNTDCYSVAFAKQYQIVSDGANCRLDAYSKNEVISIGAVISDASDRQQLYQEERDSVVSQFGQPSNETVADGSIGGQPAVLWNFDSNGHHLQLAFVYLDKGYDLNGVTYHDFVLAAQSTQFQVPTLPALDWR